MAQANTFRKKPCYKKDPLYNTVSPNSCGTMYLCIPLYNRLMHTFVDEMGVKSDSHDNDIARRISTRNASAAFKTIVWKNVRRTAKGQDIPGAQSYLRDKIGLQET